MNQEIEKITISYAQNKEDILLNAFFPDIDKGFYVDIGASHPVVSSVTKLFYEKGWRGINIEPNRKYYKLLVKDRPEDTNINVGISNNPGRLKFREYKGWGFSTFSESVKKQYEKDLSSSLTQSYKDYEVSVKTLKQVFDENKVSHINFMKIDIEGFEYEALVSNDWGKYRPEVICIESNHMVKDWRPFLADKGYIKVFFDGLNDYYIAKESKKRADYFSYPNAALLDQVIIPLRWHQEMGALNRRIQINQQSAESKKKELEREIKYLQTQIEYNSRIRHQAIGLARNLDKAIKIHIEKLNKPKGKRRKIKKAHSISVPNTADRSVLLIAARLYDLDAFYSEFGKLSMRRNYTYKAASFFYKGARKIARSSIKKSYHGARKTLKLRRNK